MWLSIHLRIQPGHPEPKRHLQEDRAQNFPRGSHPMKRMVSTFWKISVDLASNNSSEEAGIADVFRSLHFGNFDGGIPVRYPKYFTTRKTPRTVRGLAVCIPAEHELHLVLSGGQDCSSPQEPCAGKEPGKGFLQKTKLTEAGHLIKLAICFSIWG